MTKIPENSAQNSPPDDLQQTTYSCGHEGCTASFETAQKLAEHTQSCPKKPENIADELGQEE